MPLASQMVLDDRRARRRTALGERPRRACSARIPTALRRTPGAGTFLAAPLVVRGTTSARSASSSPSPGARRRRESIARAARRRAGRPGARARDVLRRGARVACSGSSRSSRSRRACRRASRRRRRSSTSAGARARRSAPTPRTSGPSTPTASRSSIASRRSRRCRRARSAGVELPRSAAGSCRAPPRVRPRRAVDPRGRRLRGGERGRHADGAPDPDRGRRRGRTGCSSSSGCATCRRPSPGFVALGATVRRPGGARAGARRAPPAQEEAVRRAEDTRRLLDLTAALAAATTLEEVSDAILERCEQDFGAAAGVVGQGDRAQRRVRAHPRLRLRGTTDRALAAVPAAARSCRWPMPYGATRSSALGSRRRARPALPGAGRRANCGGTGAPGSPSPCPSQGGPSAAWRCRSPDRAASPTGELDLVGALARQAGQAFERARALEAEQQARGRAERMRGRARAAARAGHLAVGGARPDRGRRRGLRPRSPPCSTPRAWASTSSTAATSSSCSAASASSGPDRGTPRVSARRPRPVERRRSARAHPCGWTANTRLGALRRATPTCQAARRRPALRRGPADRSARRRATRRAARWTRSSGGSSRRSGRQVATPLDRVRLLERERDSAAAHRTAPGAHCGTLGRADGRGGRRCLPRAGRRRAGGGCIRRSPCRTSAGIACM